jgi:SAM-dependent methyltransferase
VTGPGRVTAIDRSASAIASSKANAAKTGAEIVLVQSTLADFSGGPFDKVAACRLNVFWTGSAMAELDAVRRLLAPEGALYICLQPPSASALDGEVAKVGGNLTAAGYEVLDVRRDDGVPAACLVARPLQPAS